MDAFVESGRLEAEDNVIISDMFTIDLQVTLMLNSLLISQEELFEFVCVLQLEVASIKLFQKLCVSHIRASFL